MAALASGPMLPSARMVTSRISGVFFLEQYNKGGNSRFCIGTTNHPQNPSTNPSNLHILVREQFCEDGNDLLGLRDRVYPTRPRQHRHERFCPRP